MGTANILGVLRLPRSRAGLSTTPTGQQRAVRGPGDVEPAALAPSYSWKQVAGFVRIALRLLSNGSLEKQEAGRQ